MAHVTSNPALHPARNASLNREHSAEDAAKLMFRLLVGLLLLIHGIGKMQSGPDQIIEMVSRTGLPAATAYLVYIGEVLAPILVIAGLWTRPAALVAAINMLVAVLLVHTADLLSLGDQGGYALELQAFYLFGALAIVLLGAGRYSIGGLNGRWN